MPNESSRRPPYTILAVGAALLLCLCVAGAAVGGFFVIRGRETTATGPTVEYVLDASARMSQPAEGGGGSRLQVAQNVLAEIVRPADPAVTAGLRVFGAGAASQSCNDTELVIAPAPATQPAIADRARGVQNSGNSDSALAEAIIAAIADLADAGGPHTLVVVTGGEDSCQPETGQLIAEEAERAGIDFQTFVIGFEVDEAEAQAIKEMVAFIDGGVYLDAPDSASLQAVLTAIQDYVDAPGTTTVQDVITVANSPRPTADASQPTAVAQATASGDSPPEQATQPPSEATEQPASTATSAALTGTTEAGDFEGQSACDHPYYPLRQGSTWTFSGDNFVMTWTVTELTGDDENAEAVINADIEEVTVTYHWICTTEGLVSYDYGNLGFSSAGLGDLGEFSFEVVDEEGTFLLPPDEMVPGATWSNSFTIQSTVSVQGQSLTSSMRMSTNYTVVGFETITTPAGTFEALRVEQTGTWTNETMGQSFSSASNGVSWFAAGVGMVRNESSAEGVTTAMELTSYSVPD
jgi:hypothetical protein